VTRRNRARNRTAAGERHARMVQVAELVEDREGACAQRNRSGGRRERDREATGTRGGDWKTALLRYDRPDGRRQYPPAGEANRHRVALDRQPRMGRARSSQPADLDLRLWQPARNLPVPCGRRRRGLSAAASQQQHGRHCSGRDEDAREPGGRGTAGAGPDGPAPRTRRRLRPPPRGCHGPRFGGTGDRWALPAYGRPHG